MQIIGSEKALFDRYYATLGLVPGASLDEVRHAYRVRAKALHPDLNSTGASAAFRDLHEAYKYLLKYAGRRAEENLRAAPLRKEAAWRPEDPVPPLPLIACSVCHKACAQPRRLAFNRVRSFLLWARSEAEEGVFCAACARRTALEASLTSAIFGWWSLPGLLTTSKIIIRNGLGGERPHGSDMWVLFQSAAAFYSRKDYAKARALAVKVEASRHPRAQQAAELVKRIDREQPLVHRMQLRDPWAENDSDIWKHALLACLVPVLIAATAYEYRARIENKVSATSVRAESWVDRHFPGKREAVQRRLKKWIS